jgi:hypothetical protein
LDRAGVGYALDRAQLEASGQARVFCHQRQGVPAKAPDAISQVLNMHLGIVEVIVEAL